MEMSKKRDVHVVPHPDGGWATKREGARRAGSRHATRKQAIEAARTTARSEKLEVVIHGKNGRIRDSYGHDPHPPKDTKH